MNSATLETLPRVTRRTRGEASFNPVSTSHPELSCEVQLQSQVTNVAPGTALFQDYQTFSVSHASWIVGDLRSIWTRPCRFSAMRSFTTRGSPGSVERICAESIPSRTPGTIPVTTCTDALAAGAAAAMAAARNRLCMVRAD
ncbi:protein of unknown function [Stenotrophomonas maltophilia]|nr:protein of unknown function [Stenotrophomonas maltophilia]